MIRNLRMRTSNGKSLASERSELSLSHFLKVSEENRFTRPFFVLLSTFASLVRLMALKNLIFLSFSCAFLLLLFLPRMIPFLLLLYILFYFSPTRHMREIQELQSRQKEEIDRLFTRLGKVTSE